MDAPTSLFERVLERLTRKDSPLREELVTQVVDHALELPIRDVVDLDQVRALILRGFTEANARRIVERHVQPGWLRYAQAILGSDARVDMLVPEPARARIHAIAAKLRVPRARWFDGAVDPVLVGRLLSPVWTQVLLSFAARLPIPGVSNLAGAAVKKESSGVTGFIARSVQSQAQKVADRGRSVMSNLGIDIDKRLADAARGFSDTAGKIFREALRERIETPEGRQLLAQITSSVVERVLHARFADLQLDADQLPLADVFEIAPQIVAHAAHSDYVQAIVRRELDAYLALESERSLRALLEELGVYDEARALLLARGQAITDRFMQRPQFSEWLARLLAD